MTGLNATRLLKTAIAMGAADFEPWFLREVVTACGFEGGYWVSATLRHGIHFSVDVNIPEIFFNYLSDHWHESPLTSAFLAENQTVIWPDDLSVAEIGRLPVVSTVAKRWALHPVVLCAKKVGPGGLHSVIGFFKKYSDNGAEPMVQNEDRYRFAELLLSAITAQNAALLSDAVAQARANNDGGAVIFDQLGYVHAASPELVPPNIDERAVRWTRIDKKFRGIGNHEEKYGGLVATESFGPGRNILMIHNT